MKVSYRGYSIEVERAGPELNYSIERESDGYLPEGSYHSGTETVREFIKILKERVDAELATDDPWGEKQEEELP